MKLILSLIVIVFSTHLLNAQVGVDQWRMHISPFDAIDVAQGNNAVYAILSRGLLEYDLDAGEKTVWTAANYLSDVSPSAIAFDEGSQNLLIGYETGNLDLIKNEQVFNLPAIVQSSVNGIKTINKIVCYEGNAYLCTGVGIVVVNLTKREVRDTYNTSSTNELILDLAVYQDSLFALTADGVRVGALSNPFLADPSQWKTVETLPDLSSEGAYNSIIAFEESLFIGYNDQDYNADTLFQYQAGSITSFLADLEINGLNTSNSNLFLSKAGALEVFDQNLSAIESIFQYNNNAFPEPQNALFIEDHYYIADRNEGLIKAINAFSSEQLAFEGPRYNDAFRVDWQRGKLAVAGGAIEGTAPSFSLRGGSFLEEEQWTSVEESNQPMIQGVPVWDYISVSVNPRNAEEVAFGTYSELPILIYENSTITDTFGFSNSLVESISGSEWARISDLQYDNDGNLWVANALSEQPLKVRGEDGGWYSFELGNSVKNKLTRRVVIDNNNVKWMAVDGAGVVAFDHGENLDNAGDDQYRLLTTGANSGDLPSSIVEAIEVDFDNNIWVGTPEGMRVLYNSSNVFEASPGEYNFQKLLIEFGENVEIVLGTTHITDIEIDGANRKWIGTASSGVFLLSEDGLSVVRNFTSENSPLLNNSIVDISIDQNSGEVFFVTNEGMISYRSDASQGDNEYTNVKVFPNPVHPDYFGPITIQGIAFNSDVKITDMAGNLVYQTVSNGGTATWNGNTLQGQRAATGVYLIWTSIDDANQRGRKVGKVVLIN
jgi:hypothetical protein